MYIYILYLYLYFNSIGVKILHTCGRHEGPFCGPSTNPSESAQAVTLPTAAATQAQPSAAAGCGARDSATRACLPATKHTLPQKHSS